MDPLESRCCKVNNVCGYDLKRGVVYVGLSSFVITCVALMSALLCLSWMATGDVHFNNQPVQAIDMLMALYCTSISIYQLILSVLLLWQSMRTKGSYFICSTWYVSHLSIVGFYSLFFCARITICMSEKYYVSGFFTIVAGIVYAGVFMYFIMIVNSYSAIIDDAEGDFTRSGSLILHRYIRPVTAISL